MLALTDCEILIFLTFDIDNLGKVHVVEKRNLRCSIANDNLYKSCTKAFFASSHRFPDIVYLHNSRNYVALKI